MVVLPKKDTAATKGAKSYTVEEVMANNGEHGYVQ